MSLEAVAEMDREKFCVEMMKRLDIQRKNEQFCDVIIEVSSGDDQARFKAHRLVLCAASPFFDKALNIDMKEKKEGVIRMEETSKAVMEKVLEYLYTGHVDINEHNAFDLFQIADYLIVPSLKELTYEFFSRTLSSSNCLSVYYTAVKHRCPEIEKRAMDFTLANFMDVTESEDFLNLSVEQVTEWIDSDNIIVEEESDVFKAIVGWTEKDHSRKQHFFELFCCVRLPYMSHKDLFNVMLTDPLAKGSEACTSIVLDTMEELSLGTEEEYFLEPPRSCLKTHEDAIVVCGNKETLCYLPSEKKWYKLADMTETLLPPHRNLVFHSSITSCFGKLYLTAATDDNESAAVRYDPLVNSWAPLKTFSEKVQLTHPAVINFRGFLFVIGGSFGGEATSSVHKYSPDTNLWQEVAPMNIARKGVCAVCHGEFNCLYAIGGQSGDGELNAMEQYYYETNTWCRRASTFYRRTLAYGTVIYDEKVMIFGGFNRETSVSKVFEVYDPALDTWNSIEWMGAPSYINGATTYKENVFILGSHTFGGRTCSLEIYNLDDCEWKYSVKVPATNEVFLIAPLRLPKKMLDLCQVIVQQ